MVQNTVGKLWLDLHPGSPLKKEMKYLVESENAEYGNPIIKEVNELKLLDPASGSGHILVEGFGLLYKMYKEEYYSDEEAVESILGNNLFGIDIDKRAVQLAQFAVLLKAAKVFPAVLKKGWLPNIYAMPEPYAFSRQEILDFLGSEGVLFEKHLSSALTLMQQAQNLGSIMRFDLPDDARVFFINRLLELRQKPSLSFYEQAVLPHISPFIQVYEILSSKHEAVAANPPYMGQKNMNESLKDYVNDKYPISKSDLFAIFMEVCSNLLIKGGLYGMINQQSWMFLSSYEALRKMVLNTQHIKSMLHLGPRTFDELSGEVVQNTVFVIENVSVKNAVGNYSRLVDYRNCEEKHQNFLLRTDEFNNIVQSNFSKIPGSPIGYWASESIVTIFIECDSFITYGKGIKGLDTGDDNYFLKNWWEPSESNSNWKPYNKGGSYRKWYGNNLFLIKWERDGYEVKNFKDEKGKLRSRPQNVQFYFKKGLEWSRVSSSTFGVRLINSSIFGGASQAAFVKDDTHMYYFLALLNSKFVDQILQILNPTLIYQAGDINRIPVKIENQEITNKYVEINLSISQQDWDSRETSWDFQQHPFLPHSNKNLEHSYQSWLKLVSNNFFQLHRNEEELNRIFIEIYGLQDKLTPDVPLKEITILQDQLDNNALELLQPPFEGQLVPVKREVAMQQLISYAIGCFMGRYRLDTTGLHIAHPNPTKEETTGYTYNGHSFEIDEDAIIPLMGSSCDFPDDAVNRFKNFLDIVWGANTRIENLNFLQECLDQDVEKFMVKDFWKVHCKMYNKKPIYWLFSSPKGTFQVLVYMHRMNAFTVEKIRSKYLIDHLKSLRSKISLMEKSESSLNAQDSRVLDKLRKDLQECEQYDMALKPFADKQITFDLDDGVTENYKLFKGVVAEIK
jgi:hypothetical protein